MAQASAALGRFVWRNCHSPRFCPPVPDALAWKLGLVAVTVYISQPRLGPLLRRAVTHKQIGGDCRGAVLPLFNFLALPRLISFVDFFLRHSDDVFCKVAKLLVRLSLVLRVRLV